MFNLITVNTYNHKIVSCINHNLFFFLKRTDNGSTFEPASVCPLTNLASYR